MNTHQIRQKQSSLWIVIYQIVEEGGVRMFFRGWLPAYLRLGPHALICFPIFEQLRTLFGLDYI